MSSDFATQLTRLGITQVGASAPLANYVPFVRSGNTLYLSGQIALLDGQIHYRGRLGDSVSIEDGYASARMCAINLIRNLYAACEGNIDRVVRCVRLGGFVNCTPDFTEQPGVINGASDLMVELFGEAGKHARTAVGVNVLPFNASVEVDAVFELSV